MNQRRWIGLAFALVGFALTIRLYLAVISPDFKFPDEGVYFDIACHVAEESVYAVSSNSPVFAVRQAPGLPVTLGLLGKVVPLTPFVAKTMNSMVAVLAMALFALAAWKLTGQWIPVLGVLLTVGFHPSWLYTSLTNYPQSFQSLWLALLILGWASRRMGPDLSTKSGLLDGGLLGLGALFVPSQVFLAPAALVFHWRQGRSWLGRYAVWAIVGGSLVLVPWIGRNLLVEEEFIPFSTNGGEQFYLGFNPQAGMNTGIQIVIPEEMQTRLVAAPSGKARERIFQEEGKNWIVSHPGQAIRLFLAKALNFLRWDNGKMVTKSERSVAREWMVRLTSLGVFAIALGGIWRGRRFLGPWVATVSAMMILLALGHACFVMRYRYRLPFEPLLLMIGLVGLLSGRRDETRKGKGL